MTHLPENLLPESETQVRNLNFDWGSEHFVLYSGEAIKACEESDIAVHVPKPMTSNNRAKGLFDRARFQYLTGTDEYECQAGERLIHRFTGMESGKEMRRNWRSACPGCPKKKRVHHSKVSPDRLLGA